MKTQEKKRVGRPSKKDVLNFDIAKNLAAKGFTMQEIADTIEINVSNLYVWTKDPLFQEAIKKGRDVADTRVEDSLYKRATGFRYKEITQEQREKFEVNEEGERVSIGFEMEIVKIVEKEQAPDVGAICFWLKNRQPKDWKDKIEGLGANVTNYVQIYRPEKYSRERVEAASRTAD